MILSRKINRIPEFCMIFCPKMLEFYIIIARKIFFSSIRGTYPPFDPPFPTPMGDQG